VTIVEILVVCFPMFGLVLAALAFQSANRGSPALLAGRCQLKELGSLLLGFDVPLLLPCHGLCAVLHSSF
jgi:hypothetical protein